MPVYKKKGPFLILLGSFRGHFSNSSIAQNVFPEKSCLRDKMGCKTMQNSCLGSKIE